MLRVFTSIIRNAPGPFKGARSLTADLLEGLADVVSPQEEQPPEPTYPAPVESQPVKSGDGAEKVEAVKKATKSEKVKDDFSEAFKSAISKPAWVRRQDFKVLAIFWESKRRGDGPITAKQASTIGDEIGLKIRHENVRKVVRTRLTEKIETTTVPESQPPTFQYQITAEGQQSFVNDYLENVD